MDSYNKHSKEIDINVSLVERLIVAQFPQWKSLAVRPVKFSGWDNRTFHLGDNMTVRLPSAARYSQQAESEYLWLPKLAPFLPLPISTPLALGVLSEVFPWHWSVYKWIEGESATVDNVADLQQFATALAQFLVALQKIDTAGGPIPGSRNLYRGGSLTVYDGEVRKAVAVLGSEIDVEAVTAVWDSALAAKWRNPPVWFHGDVSAGNLLVRDGRLSAVIDFGCFGVGDPACDLSIAWTLFEGESREAFRMALCADEATWARGRGWTLWKALIKLAKHSPVNLFEEARNLKQIIDDILADYESPV